MQFHRYSIMAGLAIFMVIMSTTTGSTIRLTCCTRVSTEEIKVPILDIEFRNGKPPCVPAFVFETKEGRVCIAPRQDWVQRTVKEFNRSKLALRKNSTTTGSPMTTQL